MMEDLQTICNVLQEILAELRKFNQTVPMLDELVEKEQAIISLEQRVGKRKDCALRTWSRRMDRLKRNPEIKHCRLEVV